MNEISGLISKSKAYIAANNKKYNQIMDKWDGIEDVTDAQVDQLLSGMGIESIDAEKKPTRGTNVTRPRSEALSEEELRGRIDEALDDEDVTDAQVDELLMSMGISEEKTNSNNASRMVSESMHGVGNTDPQDANIKKLEAYIQNREREKLETYIENRERENRERENRERDRKREGGRRKEMQRYKASTTHRGVDGAARRSKTRRSKTRRSKTRRSKTRRSKTRRSKPRRSKTRRSKTRRSKTRK